MIAAAGSYFGGWSFYLKNGIPTAYAAASQMPDQQFRVSAAKALPAGANKLRFTFEPAGAGGLVKIYINGSEATHAEIAIRPRVMAGNGETFDTGRDSNVPVSDDYTNEGVFTGEIEKVEVDVTMPAGGPSPTPQKMLGDD